jgi:4-hydroxy-tetrahydrodipicolinate synthase
MLDDVRDALRTVVAIPVTPFTEDAAAIDEKTYAALVERLVAAGVTTVTPNGNTGEFYSLSPAELARAVELTLETAAGRAVVIAGVGHEAREAARMAREAAALGAQAVMAHQPVHPYQSEQGWLDYHRAVAETVPDRAVICYLRSPRITACTLERLAEACPNVIGIKYAVPDIVAFASLAAAVDRLTWVCGLAETWAPFFWVGGAEGFTSGLVNIAPEASLALLERLRAHDMGGAMDLWRGLKPIEDMRARDASAGNVSVIKEALAQLGLCGRGVRPPISELSDAERAEVAEILRGLT